MISRNWEAQTIDVVKAQKTGMGSVPSGMIENGSVDLLSKKSDAEVVDYKKYLSHIQLVIALLSKEFGTENPYNPPTLPADGIILPKSYHDGTEASSAFSSMTQITYKALNKSIRTLKVLSRLRLNEVKEKEVELDALQQLYSLSIDDEVGQNLEGIRREVHLKVVIIFNVLFILSQCHF